MSFLKNILDELKEIGSDKEMREEEFRKAIAKTGRNANGEIADQLVQMAKTIGERETLVLIGFIDAMMGRC